MEGDYPSPKKSAAEKAATLLLGFKGVLRAKPLEEGEKEELLSAEERSEKKVAFGMCRPYNEGVRLALCRDVSIAVVVDTSEFVYPHEPHMRILFRGSVVGEDIYDKEKAEELKKSKNNVFLWDNFVVYND
ncbi:MAG: hypothetical protein QXF24_01595, partial [Thermoproteota archaeon]